MTLSLHFADHSRIDETPWAEHINNDSTRLVPSGCPIIVDENFWPIQSWNDFLHRYARNVSLNSAKAYGRDLFKPAKYLENKSLTWDTVTNDDLLNYRNDRFSQGT